MKRTLIYSMILATAVFSSCKGDYDDWAAPQGYPQDEAKNVTLTVTPASAIDMAAVETDSINLFTSSIESAEPMSIVGYKVELGKSDESGAIVNKQEINASTEGKVATADLTSAVEALYGKAPDQRTIETVVVASLKQNGQAFYTKSNQVQTLVTLIKPNISSAYYLVGDMLTWDAAGMVKFTHSDTNVYDDPIFEITFETTSDNQYWKIIPQENVDGEFWGNPGVVGPKVDGDDSMAGSLTNENPGAGKIAKAGKYTMTINMMDYTYTIQEIKYEPFIYFIGATDGWANADQKLALTDDANGVYTGYIYCADPNNCGNEFKFQRVPGSWDNEINAGTFSAFEGAADNKGGNIGVSDGEGVYYFEVNLGSGSIKATKVNSMGIIGDFNSWAGDVEMKWNADEYCFEATNVGVTAAGWKFRVNNGWDINLGGTLQNLVLGGDNLAVAGNTIKLYPTRKTSDNIYCTVK